ncbi:MAG: response regulator transcription factor [Synergistaceae bacterium]|nr:response regulator transcription factor [Synergistaceae bacterium]
MNERILIAEDDPAILAGVSDLLTLEGYSVTEAADGRSALELYDKERPDLVLLDVMMPNMSGYDVCRAIRRADSLTPILMLTAKSEEIDKVVGLELGADDYIVKPFGIAELMARVRAAIRRGALSHGGKSEDPSAEGSDSRETLRIGETTVDFGSMSVRRNGQSFPLTPKETALLKYLAANRGKVVSRETLLEVVWGIGSDCDITTRSVDQHIARIRQKLEQNPASPRILHTAHGIGYRFECGDPREAVPTSTSSLQHEIIPKESLI